METDITSLFSVYQFCLRVCTQGKKFQLPVKNLSLVLATQKYKKSNTTPQWNCAPLLPHTRHPTPLQTETLHTIALHFSSFIPHTWNYVITDSHDVSLETGWNSTLLYAKSLCHEWTRVHTDGANGPYQSKVNWLTGSVLLRAPQIYPLSLKPQLFIQILISSY